MLKEKICFVPDVDQIKTGAHLKALRQSKLYSVSDIAIYADVTDSAVYAWEKGKSLPSISNLTGLQALYGLEHLDDLLVRTQSVA